MFLNQDDQFCTISLSASMKHRNLDVPLMFLGIPENEDLADTYYSQFDEEFEDDKDSDSDANDGTLLSTVKDRTVIDKMTPGRYGGNKKHGKKEEVESAGDDDMRVFITCMQNALDKNDTCKLFSVEYHCFIIVFSCHSYV